MMNPQTTLGVTQSPEHRHFVPGDVQNTKSCNQIVASSTGHDKSYTPVAHIQPTPNHPGML